MVEADARRVSESLIQSSSTPLIIEVIVSFDSTHQLVPVDIADRTLGLGAPRDRLRRRSLIGRHRNHGDFNTEVCGEEASESAAADPIGADDSDVFAQLGLGLGQGLLV